MHLNETPLSKRDGHSIRRSWSAIALLLVVGTTLLAAPVRADKYPLREDVASLDGLMHAYYDVVSGPANTPRNVERDLSLHHPGAQMVVPDRDSKGQLMLHRFNVREFHEWGASVYTPGFFESEVRREVLNFGRLTHVWSTYQTRRTPTGPVIARGINSIQVYFDGDRYWITSETWDSERADNPIPAKFLSEKK